MRELSTTHHYAINDGSYSVRSFSSSQYRVSKMLKSNFENSRSILLCVVFFSYIEIYCLACTLLSLLKKGVSNAYFTSFNCGSRSSTIYWSWHLVKIRILSSTSSPFTLRCAASYILNKHLASSVTIFPLSSLNFKNTSVTLKTHETSIILMARSMDYETIVRDGSDRIIV